MESFIPFRCCSYTNMLPHWPYVFVGLAMTIYTVYARYFWQGNHLKYTVIYGVYIRLWPALCICTHTSFAWVGIFYEHYFWTLLYRFFELSLRGYTKSFAWVGSWYCILYVHMVCDQPQTVDHTTRFAWVGSWYCMFIWCVYTVPAIPKGHICMPGWRPL